MGGLFGTYYMKGNSEPAQLRGINTLVASAYFGIGMALGAYGTFVKRYNLLWLGAGVLPVTIYYIVSKQN